MPNRTLELHDDTIDHDRIPLSRDGSHLLKEVQGIKIYAEVKGGAIHGYYGERDGKKVPSFTLREAPSGGSASRAKCYICCEDEAAGMSVCQRIDCY